MVSLLSLEIDSKLRVPNIRDTKGKDYSLSLAKCPQPPRPSSTPANNNSRMSQNDFEVTVSMITSTDTGGTSSSEDEDGADSPKIIKPSPIRLNPGFDPVWRPF